MSSLYDPYEQMGIYLFGLPMSQVFADVLLWERILNAHPPASLLELGTGEGGFSRYLYTQASFRGFGFLTFDHVEPAAVVPGFIEADVLTDADKIIEMMVHPTILFCDDGDKPAEVALYAPRLTPGDILVVHDWGTEIFDADIPDCLSAIHVDWCFELRSRSRIFVRDPEPIVEPEVEAPVE